MEDKEMEARIDAIGSRLSLAEDEAELLRLVRLHTHDQPASCGYVTEADILAHYRKAKTHEAYRQGWADAIMYASAILPNYRTPPRR